MYCKVKKCEMVHKMVRDGNFMKRSLIEGEGGCFIKSEGVGVLHIIFLGNDPPSHKGKGGGSFIKCEGGSFIFGGSIFIQ